MVFAWYMLSRPSLLLSTSAFAFDKLWLDNSSYHVQPRSIIVNYYTAGLLLNTFLTGMSKNLLVKQSASLRLRCSQDFCRAGHGSLIFRGFQILQAWHRALGYASALRNAKIGTVYLEIFHSCDMIGGCAYADESSITWVLVTHIALNKSLFKTNRYSVVCHEFWRTTIHSNIHLYKDGPLFDNLRSTPKDFNRSLKYFFVKNVEWLYLKTSENSVVTKRSPNPDVLRTRVLLFDHTCSSESWYFP